MKTNLDGENSLNQDSPVVRQLLSGEFHVRFTSKRFSQVCHGKTDYICEQQHPVALIWR